MSKRIKDLSRLYAEKGEKISYNIQNTLAKYDIKITEITPTSISFHPWPTCDDNSCEVVRGTIIWNPINRYIDIIYYICLGISFNYPSYSRCLKWYLSKWNEKRTKPLARLSIKFIYPGDSSSEIILKSRSKIGSLHFEKHIKMLLILFNDIIQKESIVISSIIEGDISSEMKQDIINDINMILAEINGNGG